MTEREFKTKVRINHRPRIVEGKHQGAIVTGYFDMHGVHGKTDAELSEEWIVAEPTVDLLEQAEDNVRELLWRKWKQIAQRSE